MKSLVMILGSIFFAATSFANPRTGMENLEQYKDRLGFRSYYGEQSQRRLRVAILDKGFAGYENELGRSLPRDTRYVAGPVENPESQNVVHGLKMAQILVDMMSDNMMSQQFLPELTLYNSFGYTNFKAAIQDAVKNKADLILYSEVWEYGGNHDGAGFINEAVNLATSKGILWVNAAGNFAQTTYNSRIQTGSDSWVHLPDQNSSVALRCAPAAGTCPAKIVLSWNDFKDDVDLGTKKDLDFVITDDLLNIVQSSALIQSDDPKENRPGYSKYPREIMSVDLKPGLYFIRVKNRSNNFGSRDQLRITADGDGMTMPSKTADETVLNPADNPSVITVGASDSERSSSSARMKKPDVLAPSSIQLSTGEEFRGSSNSAAIVAAGIGILKSINPDWKRKEILRKIQGGSSNGGDWSQRGLPLQLLEFGPTGPGCFISVQVNPLPPYARNVLSRGGVLVQTTAQDFGR